VAVCPQGRGRGDGYQHLSRQAGRLRDRCGVWWAGGSPVRRQLSAVSPASFTFLRPALVLMAVVLGDMGSTPGMVLGAVFISVAPEFMREFSDWRYLAFGILLIVVMIFRPQGLWPSPVVTHQLDGDS